MFTVALIGPDGAGKTTISRRLLEMLPRATSIYMGVNPDASNVMLPTTRVIRALRHARGIAPDTGGPPDLDAEEPRPRSGLRAALSELKSGIGLLNRVAEEWYRQMVAWSYQRRGWIVLFDRHFLFDYHDPEAARRKRPASRRFHSLMLERFFPKPDLVICLDAPAEVMFARKGEGTLALLERRRQEYLRMRNLAPHFAVVDAAQSQEAVAREVARLIEEFGNARKLPRVRAESDAAETGPSALR